MISQVAAPKEAESAPLPNAHRTPGSNLPGVCAYPFHLAESLSASRTPKLQSTGKKIGVGQLRAGSSIDYGRRVEVNADKRYPGEKKEGSGLSSRSLDRG